MDGDKPSRKTRLNSFALEVWRVAQEAPFANGVWLYFVLVFVGVGWATFVISFYNKSDVTPETLGTFSLGILIAVFADAMFAWKKGLNDRVAQAVMVLSLLLTIWASYLSVKNYTDVDGKAVWKFGAESLLWLVLLLAVWLWGMMLVVDPRLSIPALQGNPAINSLKGS